MQVSADTGWAAIASGASASVAVKTDGTLWVTGTSVNGQLGMSDQVNQLYFTKQGPSTDWAAVAGNLGSYLALKTNGTLWAWGLNTSGVLGDGTIISRSSPVQIGALTNWSKISAGGAGTSYAIKTDGTLWAWGANSSGQLGDGTITAKSSPVQIGSDTNWASVIAGLQSALATKTDGTLWSWGLNGSGQLGSGTLTPRSSPAQVGSLTNWSKLYADVSGSSFAIKTDGTLWAWGINTGGKLGDGTSGLKSSPVQIGSLTSWTDIVILGVSATTIGFTAG